jgi:hypothetical protein
MPTTEGPPQPSNDLRITQEVVDYLTSVARLPTVNPHLWEIISEDDRQKLLGYGFSAPEDTSELDSK